MRPGTLNHEPRRTSAGTCRRLCAGAAATLALTLTLAGCGGGGSSDEDVTTQRPSQTRTDGTLKALKAGELLPEAQRILRLRHARAADGAGASAGAPLTAAAPAEAPLAAGAVPAAPTSATPTPVAVGGEADLLQTDGRRIFTLGPALVGIAQTPSAQLTQWERAEDGRVAQTGAVPLPDGTLRGLHLAAQAGRLAALVEQGPTSPPCPPGWDACAMGVASAAAAPPREVVVQTASVGASGPLVAGRTLRISGRLVASRQIGERLLLVTAHEPSPGVLRSTSSLDAAAFEARLATLKASDILPTLKIDDSAPRTLLPETDCHVQPANASLTLEVTTLTVLNLADADAAPVSRCFLGGSEALHVAERNVYLATTRWSPVADDVVRIAGTPEPSTDLHKFVFDGQAMTYRASGSVPGHLGWNASRKAERLSEHGAHLRVLTFTGETGWIGPQGRTALAPSPATLTVLTEDGQALRTLGSLPNARRSETLGNPGEQVDGVRFAGTRAFLSTSERSETLHVLDLSDPADPRVAGVLDAPGGSAQFHELAPGLLLGLGRDLGPQGTWSGVRATLYDVANASRPAVLASIVAADAMTATALDHTPQGLALQRGNETARLAIPMANHQALPRADGAPTVARGLLRLEVDLGARTLRQLPTLETTSQGSPELGTERALHIGAHVYHLSQGLLQGWRW